jgi:hypothetical protein
VREYGETFTQYTNELWGPRKAEAMGVVESGRRVQGTRIPNSEVNKEPNVPEKKKWLELSLP